MFRAKIASPIGDLYAELEEDALLKLSFFPMELSTGEPPELLSQLEEELSQYFSGERREFTVPVRIEQSAFRRKCLEAMRSVPYGETITYSELASRAGSPRAVRAAGSACANNPVAIIYPCHRIVRKNKTIGAYGGGVEVKEWLLRHEGII